MPPKVKEELEKLAEQKAQPIAQWEKIAPFPTFRP
jgi:hypothetical protein